MFSCGSQVFLPDQTNAPDKALVPTLADEPHKAVANHRYHNTDNDLNTGQVARTCGPQKKERRENKSNLPQNCDKHPKKDVRAKGAEKPPANAALNPAVCGTPNSRQHDDGNHAGHKQPNVGGKGPSGGGTPEDGPA